MATVRMDVPIGTVIDFAGNSVPDGYLECDGSAVSRTTYAKLFAAIGTAWGAGNGSTTFNLPNLNSRVTIGTGWNRANTGTYYGDLPANLFNVPFGEYGGQDRHTLTVDEIPPHHHSILAGWGENSPGFDSLRYQYWGGADNGWKNFFVQDTGGGLLTRTCLRTPASGSASAQHSREDGGLDDHHPLEPDSRLAARRGRCGSPVHGLGALFRERHKRGRVEERIHVHRSRRNSDGSCRRVHASVQEDGGHDAEGVLHEHDSGRPGGERVHPLPVREGLACEVVA